MSDAETDTTVYSFTMQYNGFVYQQYMNFIPQNTNPISSDEKYFVYSYKYVIYLVNNMIQECLTGLAALTTLPTAVAPKMVFNTDSQLCSMELDDNFFGYNGAGLINMYMNTQLYALFSSLSAKIIYGAQGMDFQLNNLISDDPTYITQEYKTIELWNPVSSIVFTSNILPIYSSVTAPLQVYIDGVLSNNNSNYNFLNIVTDFIGDEILFVPYIQYAPSIYRILNLKPNNEVRNIDIQ